MYIGRRLVSLDVAEKLLMLKVVDMTLALRYLVPKLPEILYLEDSLLSCD